jgi:hypothetical protein
LSTSQKKPLIPNTEDTKDKKIKFQKINLILRTYVANKVLLFITTVPSKMLTRTRDMISAKQPLDLAH